MPGNDGLGSGQADAIAASGTVPGGVGPVEAVKVPGELGGVHPLAGVGDRDAEIPTPLGYLQADGPAGVTVFDRVIQQDTLASEQDGKERVWSCQGEELEIDSFQNALNTMTADEFTKEKPSGKEEIGLTVYLDQENAGTIQIGLYRRDGEHCLAVVDGEIRCLVKRADVVDLIEAVHAIVLE